MASRPHHAGIQREAVTRSPKEVATRPSIWLSRPKVSLFLILASRLRIALWAGILVSVAVFLRCGRGAESLVDVTPFQFAFSSGMLASVNHNDARAAIKVWAQTVAKERGIPADPDAHILSGVDEISAKLRARELDAIALTTVDYRQLQREYQFTDLFLAVQGGRTNVEYLLLVHRDSPVQDLAGLQGRKLNFYDNPRASLAPVWLDTLLLQQGLKGVAAFFGRVSSHTKLSTALLPVFFRQSDACVVDRLGFDTMCELNPQVGKQLRPVAVSPVLVPMLFCVRPDYRPAIKDRIMDALAQLHTSPAGQQLLTVLQFDRIQAADASCLESALSLLATHDRLCDKPNATRTAVQASAKPDETEQP